MAEAKSACVTCWSPRRAARWRPGQARRARRPRRRAPRPRRRARRRRRGQLARMHTQMLRARARRAAMRTSRSAAGPREAWGGRCAGGSCGREQRQNARPRLRAWSRMSTRLVAAITTTRSHRLKAIHTREHLIEGLPRRCRPASGHDAQVSWKNPPAGCSVGGGWQVGREGWRGP